MKDYVKEERHRTCLQCGKDLCGRSDKKFCSSECRSVWHNNHRKDSRQYRNRILTALSRNYEILDKALLDGKLSIDLIRLEDLGFRPSIITGHIPVRYGHDQFRCFDICYCRTAGRVFNLRRDPPEF